MARKSFWQNLRDVPKDLGRMISGSEENGEPAPQPEENPPPEPPVKSWDHYPTMREQAGELDDRPENIKDMERRELYRQDMKNGTMRETPAQVAERRAQYTLEYDQQTARSNDRERAQAPLARARREAGDSPVEQQSGIDFYTRQVDRAQRAADANERSFGGASWEATQTKDELARLKNELAKAKRSA